MAFEKYMQNPPVKEALRAGLPLPMFALLETTGRTSGKRRHTPVKTGGTAMSSDTPALPDLASAQHGPASTRTLLPVSQS